MVRYTGQLKPSSFGFSLVKSLRGKERKILLRGISTNNL